VVELERGVGVYGQVRFHVIELMAVEPVEVSPSPGRTYYEVPTQFDPS
jgi:hypothetical protein